MCREDEASSPHALREATDLRLELELHLPPHVRRMPVERAPHEIDELEERTRTSRLLDAGHEAPRDRRRSPHLDRLRGLTTFDFEADGSGWTGCHARSWVRTGERQAQPAKLLREHVTVTGERL